MVDPMEHETGKRRARGQSPAGHMTPIAQDARAGRPGRVVRTSATRVMTRLMAVRTTFMAADRRSTLETCNLRLDVEKGIATAGPAGNDPDTEDVALRALSDGFGSVGHGS